MNSHRIVFFCGGIALSLAPFLASAFTIRWNPAKPLEVTVEPPPPPRIEVPRIPTPDEIFREVQKAPENILKETSIGAGNVVNELGKGGRNVATEIGIGLGNVAAEVTVAQENVARETVKAILDIAATTEKAAQDVDANLKKAGKDVEWNVAKAGRDAEGAAHAIGHYIEHSVQSQGKLANEAAIRMREGKFIDAIWHHGMGQFQETENNLAKAAQESELLAIAGQVAAQAYGGPAGAAAYSAWLTYKTTGNLDLAVRTGIITYASATAMAEAGKMPSNGADYALARKTAVTAAIGGATVAAAGGDANAVQQAFLQAGAMVLVQDHYQDITEHDLDRDSMKSSIDKQAYCAAPTQSNCTPLAPGEIRDRRVPSVGIEGGKNPFTADTSPLMNTVSKVPGMQGMSIMHDQWVIQADLNRLNMNMATIGPAIVVYYTGTGAPYYEHLRRTIMEKNLADAAAKLTGKPVPFEAKNVFDQKQGIQVEPANVTQSYLCTKDHLGRQLAVEKGKSNSGFACRVVENSAPLNSYAPSKVYWKARKDPTLCDEKAMRAAMRYESQGWQCQYLPPADAVALAEQKLPAENPR